MRRNAAFWIEHLQLHTHIEGGAFREIYRSPLKVSAAALPDTFTGERNYCTGIYFLLQQHQYSAFHRIQSDETWHFYDGDPLIIYEIDPGGTLTEHWLGNDPEKGCVFQCTISARNWFAAKVAPGGDFTLAGCTVSPGFDFADFELATASLASEYPEHAALIHALLKV